MVIRLCYPPYIKKSGRAVSRILSPPRRTMIISLGYRSPGISCNLPGSLGRAALKRFPIWSCTRWGLPCLPCRHESGELLPRHFNLTCARNGGPSAVCFLWHFPPVTRSSRYEPPCPVVFGLSSLDLEWNPERSCARPKLSRRVYYGAGPECCQGRVRRLEAAGGCRSPGWPVRRPSGSAPLAHGVPSSCQKSGVVGELL